jgi:putative ABC transport system permease protein
MMGELIVRNLFHRPVRTIIGILAIAVEVALVVLIVGLTSGMLTETAKRIEGIGADIMLQPPAASIFLGFSGSPMPIKIADKLRDLKYVQAVAPALLQFNSNGGVEVVYGIDPDSFRAVSGGFVFLSGHDMQASDDVLVDDWAAKAKHLKVGDTYNLFNNDWRVAGIVEHGKGSRIFVPISTLQDLVGAHDKASIFLVKCTRPEHTEDVIEDLRRPENFPGYTIRPLKELMSLMTSTNIPGLQTFIDAMIALAVSIGLLVIFLTMYTTVIERTRDIGVLKSLGANSPFIVRALLLESALLCLFGIVAGIALSYGVRAAFVAIFPTLPMQITAPWLVRAGLIALVGTVLGASYPAWVASKKDAVEALTFD